MKKGLKLSMALAISMSMVACGSSESEDEMALVKDAEPKVEAAETFPEDALYEIINEIPSPLETSALIHESGALYNESMLNDVDNSDGYTTKYSQAVNLGIYSTNLGYINMYSNYSASLNYLGAIKDLAEELRVSQFFDFATIKRLASNNENIDSILQISTSGFDQMNNYLRSEGRDEISVLILVGGWVEALYILTDVASKSPTPALIERIGEQKIFIEDIATVVGLYESHGYFNQIASDIEDLKTAYETVTIEYVEGEQKTTVIDGVPVVENTSESKIVMADNSLALITGRIQKIRKALIDVNEN